MTTKNQCCEKCYRENEEVITCGCHCHTPKEETVEALKKGFAKWWPHASLPTGGTDPIADWWIDRLTSLYQKAEQEKKELINDLDHDLSCSLVNTDGRDFCDCYISKLAQKHNINIK